ncbi:hypothetical protein D9758_006633 [Tetrapyrgos nigripes]|uniref:Uncharacterized protein n=1 Tax=Tetrapyrgos nigripes TaxID=182062 RepID=A0A8H5GJN5_9AGAR|nr:hypothetical protein D9758_006633 [Tetrapyrgos nigripes]
MASSITIHIRIKLLSLTPLLTSFGGDATTGEQWSERRVRHIDLTTPDAFDTLVRLWLSVQSDLDTHGDPPFALNAGSIGAFLRIYPVVKQSHETIKLAMINKPNSVSSLINFLASHDYALSLPRLPYTDNCTLPQF